ncbi:MAG: NADH-ubiquinone oxidoreductase-F iron-sulfur binding region domain-containing protein [Phycisphaerae bacterium]
MEAPTTINLEATADEFRAAAAKTRKRIILCAGTGCVANGALKVHEALLTAIREAGLDAVVELKTHDDAPAGGEEPVWVSTSGCQGFCQMGPLVTIEPDGVMYCKVRPEDAGEIARQTIAEGNVVERLLYVHPSTQERCRGVGDIPFYTRQKRTVLKGCGELEPGDIREYIAMGGYRGAHRAIREMRGEEVCHEVTAAGLRGRGGGGFPTGRKWELTRIQPEGKKYVICNGDEGDPGAFMDRSVMEGNPHAVIEGMIIAARAIGADEGYIYVRMEYPLAVQRMRAAIAQAEEAGVLGEGLFGTKLRFRLHVMEGAGAFVCGEETALMASIEGKRGMPMPKPPFPAQSGLWGKPTVINNVETLAGVPLILREGPEAYRALGTENSPGTKTFALTGHVANTGLIEVPFGTTLGEIVHNIGGGVTDDFGNVTGEQFKAVQIGGPSGGCLTPEHMDLPLDFDSLREVGAMVGSGGLVVMNQKTCMVSVAHFFMQFTQNESCGKCVLCREGTRQMLALLEDIMEGRADAGTLELLDQLGRAVAKGSLCGLGKTAPSPVLSVLSHFRDEVEAHVFGKRCPAGQCKALAVPEIDPSLCKGCTACKKVCPVDAIAGQVREPHTIDAEKCIKCGACAEICKFNAVVGV